jgi:prepilin-type processing-associated H-X9-DG protein
MEQSALYGMTAGKTYATPQHLAAFTTLCTTPITVMYCPSRRTAKAYPYHKRPMANQKTTSFNNQSTGYFWDGMSGPETAVAKNDYVGNGGQYYMTSKYPPGAMMCSFGGPTGATSSSPSLYGLFDSALANNAIIQDGTGYWTATVPDGLAAIEAVSDGVFGPFSHIAASQISDGTSNTYLCGEKSLGVDEYETGVSRGDDECAFMGFDVDIVRFAEDSTGYDRNGSDHGAVRSPICDTANAMDIPIFGGPHAYGANMGFCDGSARLIGYGIDSTVHARLCNRKDGAVVDVSELDR